MLELLFIIPFIFLLTTFFGYVVHRSLHQTWTGNLHKSHMAHHLKFYPANDFFSDKYRDAGVDNTVRIFAFAAIPVVALPFVLYFIGLLSLTLTIIILVEMGIIGFLHDFLHDSFHITNHYLNRVPVIGSWFKKLINLHQAHHFDMNKNFGIFSFTWDKIFKSFKSS